MEINLTLFFHKNITLTPRIFKQLTCVFLWLQGKLTLVWKKMKGVGLKAQNLQQIEAHEFEAEARKHVSKLFGVELSPRTYPNVPKKFDGYHQIEVLSEMRNIIRLYAIRKYRQLNFLLYLSKYGLSRKTNATTKFLVFGNDKRVHEG